MELVASVPPCGRSKRTFTTPTNGGPSSRHSCGSGNGFSAASATPRYAELIHRSWLPSPSIAVSSYRNASGFHPPLSDLAAFSYGLIGVSLPFFGRKLKLNRYLQPSIGRIGNCAFAFGGHDSRGHDAALIGALTRARASSAKRSAPTGAEAERPHRPTHRTASHRAASHRTGRRIAPADASHSDCARGTARADNTQVKRMLQRGWLGGARAGV